MNKEQLWKNFNLGIELDIAGNFIYNSLKTIDEMQNFYYEDEIFTFLYQISVGIERLEKIVIILTEHNEIVNQKIFEKELKHHNHEKLLERIRKYHSVKFDKKHNNFIKILSLFYKNMRYDRYILENIENYNQEKIELEKFINKYSTIKIKNDFPFDITQNNNEIKIFIGTVIKKIVLDFYNIIVIKAREENIYIDDIRIDSKAYKIFKKQEFDFLNESIFWKELLIFILNNKNTSGVLKFIKDIEPLQFDPIMLSEYLNCFKDDLTKLKYIEEMETYHEDIKNIKERKEILELIGMYGIDFDSNIN